MTDIDLTQADADALIAMPKIRENEDQWPYPGLGGAVSIPLLSSDKRERFVLDVSRGQINLAKGRYQNRARQIVVLLRLDFGGPSHRNPDGEEIPCPHLHTYREGFGDKWAVVPPNERFPDLNDPWHAFEDFMRYCNIVQPPIIQKGLSA
jgi:hypothetical protein